MIDVERLYKATPISGLAAQQIARVYGLPGLTPNYPTHEPAIELFEPPAARKAPFADAVPFLRTLLVAEGVDENEAEQRAKLVWSELRPRLDIFDRALRLDDFHLMSAPEGCPLPILLEVARKKRLAGSDALSFWERGLYAVEETRLYPPEEESGEYRRLRDLPDLPLPLDLFEFVCSLPYGIVYALTEDHWEGRGYAALGPFVSWREGIRPTASRLEESLGSWVYYFADFDCDTDDDASHRFLSIHMLASLLPDCPFVRYLMEACGARSVDDLLAALIDPTSYSLPFVSWDAFGGREPLAVRIDYRSLHAPAQIGLIADAPNTLVRLRERCLARIGDDVRIVVPEGKVDREWLREATRHNVGCSFHSGWQGAMEYLRGVDRLTLLFDHKAGLSDHAVALGIEAMRSGTPMDTVGSNGATCVGLLEHEAKMRGIR